MRDFLKHTLATVLGLLIFLGLSIGGLVSLAVLFAASDREPKINEKSVLVFNLATPITDAQRSATTLSEVLSEDDTSALTLRSVVNALDEATRDPNIVGLYLYGNGEGSGGTGLASLREVRGALQRFRESGKKIIAYDVDWREREYYLGSVANSVILNPIGSVELNGLSSESAFFAGALKKFGVGIQVTRVGKYKAAVEPLLLTKRSPENREQTQVLLDDLWQGFLDTTSKDRKLNPQQLQAIVDTDGILMAEAAKQQGLVDRLAHFDEVIAELRQLTGEGEQTKSDGLKSFRQVSLERYTNISDAAIARKRTSKNEIAVVYAEGEIVSGQGGRGEVGGDRLARQLRQLRQDEDVKAVVLRINSPGGGVTPSEVIQREVMLTRKAKPVVVSMGSVAASGGYWIAADSDRIFAEPNTVTGSIGVFGVIPNIQELSTNNGITWDSVKTGKFADIQTLSRPRTPEEMAKIQRMVDRIYDQFITKVAESRKLPREKVAEIAQGRVWSGQRAKELGLVDELGGLEAAVQDAAKRAKLGDDWKVQEYPKSRSFEERLVERLIGDQALNPQPSDPLTKEFKKLQADLATLRSLNDPLGVYARLPFNFRVD
jgi:protease-4